MLDLTPFTMVTAAMEPFLLVDMEELSLREIDVALFVTDLKSDGCGDMWSVQPELSIHKPLSHPE